MAISKYLEKDGQEYFKVYVHVRSKVNPDRRSQKYSYKLKTEADARREEKRLYTEASREIGKIDGQGLLWKEVVNLWMADVNAKQTIKITQRTALDYLSIIKKWTGPWMNKPASVICRADGREVLIMMEKEGLAWAYQKRVKNIVNRIYEWGIEYRYIQNVNTSPLKGLLVTKGNEKPPEILTLVEIKKFLRSAKLLNHPWYSIWSFAVLTGMRSGELYALTWDQIDLEKEVILVDRSYDANMRCFGPTKGRYWRTVPISSSLKCLILELKANINPMWPEFVLPRLKTWKNGDQAGPIKEFLKSINIRPIKFHSLRACFATQMLASGVSAPIVMRIGGWKNSATMDIYLRLSGVDTKGATECLGFLPDEITFGDNVINLFQNKTSGGDL